MLMNCCPCLLRKIKTSSINRSVEVDEEFSGIQNVKMYTYEELKAATGDFSSTTKIGEGGYGSVYKGKFKGGYVAAIKVLSPDSTQGVREFLTELNVISDIEHENLVKLDGCCVQGNQRILVYGYLENNSLAQKLLGKHSHNARYWEILGHDGNDNTTKFDWKIRTKICIGVARGLAYLHEEVHPHIVHRDIKASNILLDKDLTPKISDFGLAKLLPANKTHVSTRVAGTIGYLAPEYAIRGQLTRKADIYSFGVLLLEIISGRCNTNEQLPPEEQYLLERTWQLYELGELAQVIDPSLDGDHDIEEACRFIRIGLLCTQEAPKLRPSMSSVVKMLEGEMKVDNETITKPGLISDFMDLKVRNPQRLELKNTSSSLFSGMSPAYNSSSSGKTTTHPSLSFTPEN